MNFAQVVNDYRCNLTGDTRDEFENEVVTRLLDMPCEPVLAWLKELKEKVTGSEDHWYWGDDELPEPIADVLRNHCRKTYECIRQRARRYRRRFISQDELTVQCATQKSPVDDAIHEELAAKIRCGVQSQFEAGLLDILLPAHHIRTEAKSSDNMPHESVGASADPPMRHRDPVTRYAAQEVHCSRGQAYKLIRRFEDHIRNVIGCLP